MIGYLTQDLMMGSRAQAAARRAEASLRIVRDLRAIEGEPVTLVIVDLQMPGIEPQEVAARVRERWPKARCLAYGPHVAVGVLREARQAGFDDVLTRGEFDRRLDALVADEGGSEAASDLDAGADASLDG